MSVRAGPPEGGKTTRDHLAAEAAAIEQGLQLPAPAMVGASGAMERLGKLIEAVAKKDCTVLIQGPSGSGKELVARHVHARSERAGGPMVAVDCTGLRDTLLESQLFGHVKGAFTGAEQSTLGFIRAADGGTVFLDEIGEMDLKTQAKLLRCIQERVVVPLGAVRPIAVDVRFICATHRDLRAMATRGEFREDLYYRLDVVRLRTPALADRREDVPALAEHFLRALAQEYGEPTKRLSDEAMVCLGAYDWPGNVRELANAVEHALVFCDSELILPEHLPDRLRVVATGRIGDVRMLPIAEELTSLEEAERRLIARALRATEGNQSKAAAILRIDRRRLARKVRRYKLDS